MSTNNLEPYIFVVYICLMMLVNEKDFFLFIFIFDKGFSNIKTI